MTDKELLKITIEEFSRVQRYLTLAEKDSTVYNAIKERYVDLKAILVSAGVNIVDIDRVKL